MRTVLPFLAFVLLSSAGAAQTGSPWERPTTLNVREVSLSEALLEVFGDAKLRFVLTPAARSLAERSNLNVNFTSVPLKSVVESLLRMAGSSNGMRLSARFDKDICVIDAVKETRSEAIGGPPADGSPGRRLISYRARNVTILQALTEVLDRVGTGFRLHPDVRAALSSRRKSVAFDEMTVQGALHQLTADVTREGRPIHFLFEQTAGYYIFMFAYSRAEPDAPQALVSLNVVDRLPVDALRTMFGSGGHSFALSPQDVGDSKVTATFSRKDALTAATLVLRAAAAKDVMARVHGGVYSVSVDWRPRHTSETDRRVTARFRSADVRYALKSAFNVSLQNYTLDHLVQGTVTTEFENLPIEEALARILKNHSGPLSLSYRIEGGVYNISSNPDWERWK